MPTSDAGKAIASRNATTHGLFARDVVLPSLGEDPDGYRQLETEWTTQLVPRNLLEQHYIEKIAAASWRLRRLHRWQAQLHEDDSLTEAQRLDRLNTVLRHETALHRQIDTAVRMLSKDVPALYTLRIRDQVLEDIHISERECRDEPETDISIEMETRNRMYRLRKATAQAANELSVAPLDTDAEEAAPKATVLEETAAPDTNTEICQNELAASAPEPPLTVLDPSLAGEGARNEREGSETHEICQNEPPKFWRDPKRLAEYLDPESKYRLSPEPYLVTKAKNRRFRRG